MVYIPEIESDTPLHIYLFRRLTAIAEYLRQPGYAGLDSKTAHIVRNGG